MFDFCRHFHWFLPVHRYDTPAQLLTELSDRVIEPSEAETLELRATTAATSLNVERDSRDPQRLAQMQKRKICPWLLSPLWRVTFTVGPSRYPCRPPPSAARA